MRFFGAILHPFCRGRLSLQGACRVTLRVPVKLRPIISDLTNLLPKSDLLYDNQNDGAEATAA